MRGWVVLLLLAPALAGCVGGEDPGDGDAASGSASALNPWQAGLADHYPTPDFVETRSAEERGADLAPPGDPEFAAFDETMEEWMAAHDVPTGTLAIMKDGQLRYANGYGYTDQAGTDAAGPDTMLRIMSITKAMTAQVIAYMVEEDRIAWDDPVFCVPEDPKPDCILPIEPHPDRPVVDSRTADITVQHFIEHTSGWSDGAPDPCNDPLWSERSIAVAQALGVQTPLPRWRVAQWGMGAELEQDPGDGEAYCNGGYIVLGLVAEAVTGATVEAVYDAYLFRPVDVLGEIEFGRSLAEDRNPRDGFYACDGGMTQSVFDSDKQVCWPAGGFSVHQFSGAGGLVATAPAVVAVMESLPVEGVGIQLDPARATVYSASGQTYGTHANTGVIETSDGKLQYAYAFNTAEPRDGCPNVPVPEQPCDIGHVRGALIADLMAWSAADEGVPR